MSVRLVAFSAEHLAGFERVADDESVAACTEGTPRSTGFKDDLRVDTEIWSRLPGDG